MVKDFVRFHYFSVNRLTCEILGGWTKRKWVGVKGRSAGGLIAGGVVNWFGSKGVSSTGLKIENDDDEDELDIAKVVLAQV